MADPHANEKNETEDVGGTAEELEGPKLLIQYATDEKKAMFIQADEDFGPFIVIAYEDIGHAGFMMQSVAVSTEMWAAMLARMGVMTELRMAASIAAARQREEMGKIAVAGQGPGFKPVPGFRP